MTTTTTTTNENKTPNAQFAPLIEFPEGGDIGDAYYRARIGMVMALVSPLLSLRIHFRIS
jgi:hypothetical protein